MENDVFVSYAKEDRSRAQEFSDWLTSCGFRVWWDEELRAGQDYPQELERIILGSRCSVVLWSANSIRSRWVYQEAELATNAGTLVPVLLDIAPEQIPIGMRTTHAIPFDDRDALLKSIQYLVKSPAAERRSRVARRLSYLGRRLPRILTPFRIALFLAAALLGWLAFRDQSDWQAIKASVNRKDFENYLTSGWLRFHTKTSREIMAEIDDFARAIDENDFRSYQRIFSNHNRTLYSLIARIAYERYENKKGGEIVFPNATTKPIDPSELAAFNCEKLRIARNQIFYRRGYCFTSDIGVSALPSADCPIPCETVLAINSLVFKSLNKFESANIDTIRTVEQSRCPAAPKPRCRE
jgi:hypothetical protein